MTWADLTLFRQRPGEWCGTRPCSGPGSGHRHPSAFAAAPGCASLLLLLQEDCYRRVSNTKSTFSRVYMQFSFYTQHAWIIKIRGFNYTWFLKVENNIIQVMFDESSWWWYSSAILRWWGIYLKEYVRSFGQLTFTKDTMDSDGDPFLQWEKKYQSIHIKFSNHSSWIINFSSFKP